MDRFHGYEGPIAEAGESGVLSETLFNSTRVRDFVRQFAPEFAGAALATVEEIEILGRQTMNSAIREFFQKDENLEKYQGGSIVPLGQAKDGSAVVGYGVMDSASEFGCEVRNLNDALAIDGPLVFVDDFLGRGSSSVSILQALLGVPASENLHENRPNRLPERLITELRERAVAFVFSAAFDDGRISLPNALAELGFKNPPIYTQKVQSQIAGSCPKKTSPTRLLDSEYESFVQECRRLGVQLLDDGEPRHDAAWRGERAGYGNHGALLIFPYNTPTVTLTVLWKSGTADGSAWRALFPRRKKL